MVPFSGRTNGRGFSRTSGGRGINFVVAATLFLCGGALTLSELEPAAVEPAREAMARMLTPIAVAGAGVADTLAGPLRSAWAWAGGVGGPGSVSADEDKRRSVLAARVADLERENSDLKALTGYVRSAKSALIAGRIVMRSSSPLSHTVVIDAGSASGVHEGLPVVAGGGLIGRVVQAYEDQASVMLLTDRLSRVPVAIGQGMARAVLVGAGEHPPRLEFVTPGAEIKAGDLVTTSGIGGVFPRGLSVGIVADGSGGPVVRLTAGEDDPLAAGVLLVDGPAYEAMATVSTRTQRILGQAMPQAKPGEGAK